MPTLLQIDTSPLPGSITRELTSEFVRTWKAVHPEGKVIHRDLSANAPSLLDANWIAAAYTPDEARTAEQKAALAQSEELISELEQADEYVFGVGMHNFTIPSVLRLWIDQVARRGRTFVYSETGPQGLLHGKKATILVASGGMYTEGTPLSALNFVDPYLKTVLGFLGVTDVKVVTAGGVAQIQAGIIDREAFLKPTLEHIRSISL